MTESDDIMTRLGEGIELSQAGKREAARRHFAALWKTVGPEGDAFHRCAVAHQMADVQDDPKDELVWDLRALEAADSVTEARAAEGGMAGPVASMFPSLHLNLGDVYLRSGDLVSARRHLQAGQASADALGQDGYAVMIRRGLAGLADRLASSE